jgi:hypothetical protein
MAGVLEHFSSFRILLALCCTYILFKLTRFGSREKHLPPGPPTYPIVGNAHLVVDKDLYKRFRSTSFLPPYDHLTGTGSKIGLRDTVSFSLSRLAKAL